MNTAPFPVWGPYGKKYMGYSRIMDSSVMPGVRFDVCTAPALRGSRTIVPNVTVPSGCHPWDCSADYRFVQYRQELSGKDVYADIQYIRDGENLRIRTVLTNRTERTQDCLVNYFLSLEYPAAERTAVDLPAQSDYLPALQYDRFEYAVPRPWDHQNPDGLKKGEVLAAEFVDGAGLGDNAPAAVFPPFGASAGDLVAYTLPLRHAYRHPSLTVRYRSARRGPGPIGPLGPLDANGTQNALLNTRFRVNGVPIEFPYSEELSLLTVPLEGLLSAVRELSGPVRLEFVSEGGGGIELDFLCVTEPEDVSAIRVRKVLPEYVPEYTCHADAGENRLTMHWPETEGCFTFRAFAENFRLRSVDSGCLEDCVPARLSNPDPTFDRLRASFSRSFRDKHSDDGFFLNPLVHTVFVKPHETVAIDAVLTYHADGAENDYLLPETVTAADQAADQVACLAFAGEGSRYDLSQSLLRAALLTNIVYPIRKHGSLILHHTPGKRWDSLYTWDSGFIGLGMTSLSRTYAEYSLDTYLSDKTNPDYAFLHHGSVVPTQFFLFNELLDTTSGTDHERILSYYPRLRLYYEFLLGRTHGSTTSPFASGLLTTYDYWYSSSGMDDYPAQAAMHKAGLRADTAPVVTSVMAIRCARILLKALADPAFSQLAEAEAYRADRDGYEQDITRLDQALNRYSWDPDAGYYSYVLHSGPNKEPAAILRTGSGENYNKGTEGIIPLLAGICSPEQEERLLAHLQDPREMLAPYGITTVDRTASYYRKDGYWNGAVWFPYQWLLWRTMFDLGRADFAWEIANRALEAWKSEVDATGYTFEMLSAETGRGGWFHNFGGLSAPLLLWADAYYRPGTVTAGFDTAVYIHDGESCVLRHFGPERPVTVLFCPETVPAAGSTASYRVTLDGTDIPYRLRGAAVEITYLPSNGPQLLRVTPSGG